MYGGNIVVWREREIEQLQVAENEVLRRMVGAPGYVAVAGVRGEIGIGTMKGRIVRDRLQYIRSIVQGNRKILGKVWEEMRIGGGRMIETTRNYCRWAGIGEEELGEISAGEVRKRVAVVQDRLWREEFFFYTKKIEAYGGHAPTQ